MEVSPWPEVDAEEEAAEACAVVEEWDAAWVEGCAVADMADMTEGSGEMDTATGATPMEVGAVGRDRIIVSETTEEEPGLTLIRTTPAVADMVMTISTIAP